MEDHLSPPGDRCRYPDQAMWPFRPNKPVRYESPELLAFERALASTKRLITKNSKDARQFINRKLAQELAIVIKSKGPKEIVFTMPHETDVATMFRKDLSVARKLWIETVKPGERDSLASDFLLPTNHSGESLDFHALRHTTGAWLSMTGAHPKVVQT